nr:type III secretion system cytoplasmic ring protein SctQ [Methylobacterium brachythecii]
MPFATTIEGLSLRLASTRVVLDPLEPIASSARLAIAIGEDQRISIALPSAVLDRLVRAVQPDLESLPPGRAGSLLLELALVKLLDAAEGIVGQALRIEAVETSSNATGLAVLVLDAVLDGESLAIQVDLGSPTALSLEDEGLAALLRLIESAAPKPAEIAAIPLPLVLVGGTTRLSLAQLKSLHVGDAVLPDTWHPDRDEVIAVLGEGFVAAATTDRHRTRLKAAFRPIAREGAPAIEDAGMVQDTAPDGATAVGSEAGIDAIDVTMRFELGRQSVAIGELKTIGEGHVFDLGLDPADPIEVSVNGAAIGRGEIITIGERLGVRLVRLYGRD